MNNIKNNFGFVTVGASVPEIRIADVDFNIEHIVSEATRMYSKSVKTGAPLSVICFPELCVTGYTCADLFNQNLLITEAFDALYTIAERLDSNSVDVVVIVGAPVLFRNKLYNCGVVLYGGSIIGIVPKSYIPNYNEFYERRWFDSGLDIKLEFLGSDRQIPFGTHLIFDFKGEFKFGIEICEDLWVSHPRSVYLAGNGADMLI